MKHCTTPLRRLELLPTAPEDEGFDGLDWMDEASDFPPMTAEIYAKEQCAEHAERRIPGNY